MTWSFINAISGKLANKWFPKDEIARATAFGLGFEQNNGEFSIIKQKAFEGGKSRALMCMNFQL